MGSEYRLYLIPIQCSSATFVCWHSVVIVAGEGGLQSLSFTSYLNTTNSRYGKSPYTIYVHLLTYTEHIGDTLHTPVVIATICAAVMYGYYSEIL